MSGQLSPDNYYNLESNFHYMSNSQYKDFVTCEAAALAKLTGEWEDEPSEAMLAGSYVHAAMEGTLDEFKALHPEVYTKKGELYSQYKQADKMIETLQNDHFVMEMVDGVKEHIITAEFAGVTWKAKLDVYNPVKGRIADIKTVRNLTDKHWDAEHGHYVSFLESFRYLQQLSIYAELERLSTGRTEWLEPIIVAVTKEDIPDKVVIGIDKERIEYELNLVKARMPRIIAMKQGKVSPNRCEHCKYCRETKKLDRIIHYTELVV